MVTTSTKTVTLFFDGTTVQQAVVNLTQSVSRITLKEVSVVNLSTSTPTSQIATLKSNIISARSNQSLCSFPLTTSTNFCLPLNTVFDPVSSTIQNTYNFAFTLGDDGTLVGADSIACWVGIVLEFTS